jgi:hypothetical protein
MDTMTLLYLGIAIAFIIIGVILNYPRKKDKEPKAPKNKKAANLFQG